MFSNDPSSKEIHRICCLKNSQFLFIFKFLPENVNGSQYWVWNNMICLSDFSIFSKKLSSFRRTSLAIACTIPLNGYFTFKYYWNIYKTVLKAWKWILNNRAEIDITRTVPLFLVSKLEKSKFFYFCIKTFRGPTGVPTFFLYIFYEYMYIFYVKASIEYV